MINFITILIFAIISFVFGYFIGKSSKAETFVNDAEKLKSQNMAKLREHLNSLADGNIDNGNVRKLLNVSDTTACRYLDDLEKEGLVKQIGTDGPKVYYKKN